jgi:signal peptidase I
MARIKRRNPIIAFALSLPIPGLGQMYNGQLARGLTMLVALLLVGLINVTIGPTTTFPGLVSWILFSLALSLSVAVDALLGARRVREIPLKWYNKWYYYTGIIVIFCLAINPFIRLIRPFAQCRAFVVPSEAMEPTLRKGDRFVARANPYRSQTPVRNDVVVFPFPKDPSKMFVKRIVGLEGDKMEIRNKQLFVNDRPLEEPWAVHDSSPSMPKARDNYGPTIVPSGCVFVLGDNRDHSFDSRFWGFVQCNTIIGKALYIYWSDDRQRIGLDVK